MRPRSLRARAGSFFYLLLSPDGTHFAENRVREWCILQKKITVIKEHINANRNFEICTCDTTRATSGNPTLGEFEVGSTCGAKKV